MRPIKTAVYPELVGDTLFEQHRDARCSRVCYIALKEKPAHSFCSKYVFQIRPATNELMEFCKPCDEK